MIWQARMCMCACGRGVLLRDILFLCICVSGLQWVVSVSLRARVCLPDVKLILSSVCRCYASQRRLEQNCEWRWPSVVRLTRKVRSLLYRWRWQRNLITAVYSLLNWSSFIPFECKTCPTFICVPLMRILINNYPQTHSCARRLFFFFFERIINRDHISQSMFDLPVSLRATFKILD